jgi:hypothetical protein
VALISIDKRALIVRQNAEAARLQERIDAANDRWGAIVAAGDIGTEVEERAFAEVRRLQGELDALVARIVGVANARRGLVAGSLGGRVG